VKATLSRDRASAHWDRSSVAAGGPDRGRGANPMARARRRSDRAAQRRLRACGGQRHLVADLDAALREVRGCEEDSVAGLPQAASSSPATPADLLPLAPARAPARAGLTCSPPRSVACTACTRAAVFAFPRALGDRQAAPPGRGAGCAAVVAVPVAAALTTAGGPRSRTRRDGQPGDLCAGTPRRAPARSRRRGHHRACRQACARARW
jgi:hypothetical protein